MWLIAAALILFAAAGVAFVLLRMKHRWYGVVAVSIGALLVVEMVEDGYETLSPLQSGYAIAQKMRPLIKPDTRVYAVEIYDQSLPFYLKRPITLVHYFDEFTLGIHSEPQKAISTFEEFPAEWMRPGEALAIMGDGQYERLQAAGLPMQLIHQDPRRTVVKKPVVDKP